jgi:hypothetical protein
MLEDESDSSTEVITGSDDSSDDNDGDDNTDDEAWLFDEVKERLQNHAETYHGTVSRACP